MANLSAPVPVEPEKIPWVHDRSRIPAAPATSWKDRAVQFQGLALGLLLALGFTALAFQTRDSWTVRRDWVVPMTIPFWATAGVALGHLVARRLWKDAAPGLALLVVAIALIGANDLRALQVDGSDNLRDALSILTGVDLGLMVVALLVAVFGAEIKNPTKAPPPAA